MAFSQSEMINYSGDRQNPETKDLVTTRLYLKPSHTSEALDKDDVLRCIRHFRQRFTSSPGRMDDFLQVERWLEDTFSAPW
uniref:Uncharacterized protein n=1 Tax=Nelumbo nucifera TaxID=4432 RepID=A0A822Z1F9_NELNU|nr:TPA_asm: hypothetical protein HUJ06_008994 [Nelumbo nucifera]